jgi:thiamine-phosphate pyrophosphorylase
VDVAIAIGASGVHLRSNDISPGEVGEVYKKCGAGLCVADIPVREKRASPIIGISCHTVAEVAQAAASPATFAGFGPVFGKNTTPPTGIAALCDACRHGIPVLALGGITLENADSCLQAGAAGIAAIRLFQENKISEIVRELL